MKQLLSPLGFRYFEFNDNGHLAKKHIYEDTNNYIAVTYRDDHPNAVHIHISTKSPSFIHENWHECNGPDDLVKALLLAIDSTKAASTKTITNLLSSMRNFDALSFKLRT